ncbi:MAG: RecX family transcriptional regulator [Bacteroidota bacterium]
MSLSQELLGKLQSFCASRERCTSEVITKLSSLGADQSQIESIIRELQQGSFLDDMRYCNTFIRQALEVKKIGKTRIFEYLKAKEIDEQFISKSLEKITAEHFKKILIVKIETEIKKNKSENNITSSAKIINKLLRDGFEEEDIISSLRINFNIEI